MEWVWDNIPSVQDRRSRKERQPASLGSPKKPQGFSPRGVITPRHWGRTALTLAALAGLAHGATAAPTPARPASDFLNSLGANSAIAARGEQLDTTIACAKYLGLRWFRAGLEGNLPAEDYLRAHREAGVRFSWSPGSGGADLPRLIAAAKPLAAAGALLAFEGPNEPNNWGVTYEGRPGGRGDSWVPVAHLMRDLYRMVKNDPQLKNYPVWSVSENGAETDNVGLQFLTIPPGAGTTQPDGTRYADFANVHNYIYHPNSPHPADNKTWNAADPGPACRVDGLYGEYGVTWLRHYPGYSVPQLQTLPRVTTETGTTIGGEITEEMHGRNLLTMYLDQFTRGWSYTAVYLLRDRVDEAGNQQFGFYRPDGSPRPAAVYLHNLTTLLADPGTRPRTSRLDYSIPDQPATVHDLLLEKSDGTFALVVWGERVSGTDAVTVRLARPRGPVTVYDVTTGTAPAQTLTRTATIPLTLSDHPLVLLFR